MLAVAPSLPSMGSLEQWSADVTEHTHIDVIKDPTRSRNNQKFNTQICCYLNHQEKCWLFTQATTIGDIYHHGDNNSDVSDGKPDLLKPRKITNYLK